MSRNLVRRMAGVFLLTDQSVFVLSDRMARRTVNVDGRHYLGWPWLCRRLRSARLDLG
jgi:hypothetical protein